MAPLAGINSFAAVVIGHVFRGTHHAVRVTLSLGGQELLAYVPPRDVLPGQLDAGSEIWLRWRPEDAAVLDAEPATAELHGGLPMLAKRGSTSTPVSMRAQGSRR
jgi:hypothetical protein